MRLVAIIGLSATMLASQAFAQGNAGFTMGDIYATHAVIQGRAQMTSMLESPGSPMGQLSKSSKKWIREETKRQAANPTTADEIAATVGEQLAKDELRIAREHHIDPMDVTRLVTLLITADAEDAAIKTMKKTQKAGDPAALQIAAETAAKATANRKEAASMQTDVSMALAMM